MTRFDEVYDSDVVIVGAGVAGLSTALALKGKKVAILSKVPFARSGAGGSSVWAQGGIAAAVGKDDSPALHAEDTLMAGAGLSLPGVVRVLTEEGPERALDLVERGTRFDRNPDGSLALGQEGAHSRRRILHANGDTTGAEIVRALLAETYRSPWVTPFGDVEALDLAMTGEEADHRVAGVVAQTAEGHRVLHRASVVVLAAGGLGQLFLHTTNPPENTGDGLAMAARAGARLVDLEFVQFHPTALAGGADPMPLLTEALRGEGAILVDDLGERFMPAIHPLAELAPRDVVARAIWRRLQQGRKVFLDAREAVGEAFPERFPTVFALCAQQGLDPRVEAVPVSPAAHFHMGGVATDEYGRSSLPGLWACGEIASSGVHGANRLASNSLLEGIVYGARVATSVRSSLVASLHSEAIPSSESLTWAGSAGVRRLPLSTKEDGRRILQIRRLAWQEVGLERTEAGLRRALRELRRLSWWMPEASSRLRNLHTVATLVAAAALERKESRGGHFRRDFSEPSEAWRHRLFFTHDEGSLIPATPWPSVRPDEIAASSEPSQSLPARLGSSRVTSSAGRVSSAAGKGSS